MTMLVVDLGGDAVGMLALSTPTGAAAQDATALDFAASLAFNAPRFSLPDDNSLTQFYASSDCVVTFAYPAGWNTLNASQMDGQFYQIRCGIMTVRSRGRRRLTPARRVRRSFKSA